MDPVEALWRAHEAYLRSPYRSNTFEGVPPSNLHMKLMATLKVLLRDRPAEYIARLTEIRERIKEERREQWWNQRYEEVVLGPFATAEEAWSAYFSAGLHQGGPFGGAHAGEIVASGVRRRDGSPWDKSDYRYTRDTWW